MKNILVLFGGCSPEYEVSLHSAASVLEHMDWGRWRPVPVGISREGQWFLTEASPEQIAEDRWQGPELCVKALLPPDRGGAALLPPGGERLPIDAAFPVLHGQNGEDGRLQGLLELAGIPVVGCGTLASALCMDKHRAHRLAAQAGVPAPRGFTLRRGFLAEEALRQASGLGLPLFVKPLRAGSSFGVSRIEALSGLLPALETALNYDTEALVEEAVPGFELGVAVLDTWEGPLAAGPDEIELAGGFFDYGEKYSLLHSRIHVPARIAPEKAAEVRAAALAVYRALGCAGFARVDLFLRPDGQILFNEVNTVPGLTAHSRFPKMMEAAGLGLGEVLNIAIGEALRT